MVVMQFGIKLITDKEYKKMAYLWLLWLTAVVVFCTAEPPQLRITTIKQEPYTMSKGSEFEGYCIDLLSSLSKSLGFKYKIQVVKDGRYGAKDEHNNWSGMIGEIVREEADMAIAPLTVTSVREMAIDMTKPFMQTGLGFILMKNLANGDSQYFSLIKLFSTEMWIGLLIAYLLTSICIFLVARISPCEWDQPETDENHFTISHSFWYTVGALTLQGAGPHPKSMSGRVITAIWWIFSLIILAAYFASLSSWLHSDSKEMSISTFEDLANQNVITYGTIKGSSSANFFKKSINPVYRRIYENMERQQSFADSMEQGIRMAQEGNYAFIGESVSLDLLVARHCNLRRSSEVIGMRGYSVAVRQGNPLLKNLSISILELSESGELDYLFRKWWASSCIDDTVQASSLQPGSMKGIFLFLALGLGLGLALAVMELASKSRRIANTQQKSCCSVLTSELNHRFGKKEERTAVESSEKSKV